jgi:CelD/BcsL family acetyltransferase involved in cellulose biosynthesis
LIRARSLDQLDRLESAWRALDADCRLPSGCFGWTRACLAALSEDAAFEIVAVEQAGRLVGVAPLVRRRLHGIPRLQMVGASPLLEPIDVVATSETVRRRLAEGLATTPVVLERMPADSPTIAAIQRACRGRALVVLGRAAPFPYVALDESWVEPQQHLDPYCASQLRRARQQAEQFGALAIEIHSPGLHDLPELLDTAFRVEAERADSGTTRGPRRDRREDVFYRQCAQAACVDGALRVSLLRIGSAVAAAEIATESTGGYWRLMAAENDRFSSCLPGQLLARETIRYAAEANLSIYAFWGRPRPGTAAWATNKQECVSLWTYPLNVRGLAALAADGLWTCCRKWRAGAGSKLAYPANHAGRCPGGGSLTT